MATCSSCGGTNAGAARFCASCGAPLAASCARCGAEVPVGARFCPSCGAAVDEPAAAGQERRVVTILFADVTGSTSLGERLDPEHLREVLDLFFSAMREEIEAQGGTVEKFIGDAVMAAFGVPVAHEDDPARALRTALRMQDRLQEVNVGLEATYGVALQIRVGVNTGEVLATISASPGDAMVTGDAVNAAARLEQLAEPGQIVTSERTARAVRGFRFGPLGAVRVRGKETPIDALVLTGETDAAERGIPGLHAPIVGRDQELALLRSMYERSAAERKPNLVTIYGDAGVGKSRLVAEFLDRVAATAPAPAVVRGRCLPYGNGVTYWPLAEILKGFAGVQDSDPPDTALERIRATVGALLTPDVSADLERTIAALVYTVGVDDPDTAFAGFEPRQVRIETLAAWRSFFSALAARAPLVAVVEDIHWADPALLDLLEELADRVQGAALFLCPSRPELTARRPGWGGGRRNVSSVALDPLSAEDADRLVSLLLTVEDLPVDVHARILERAEGNPFFLEEIVRHLIDEGGIVRRGGRWRAAPGITEVEIPDTVQGVLASRIDLLAPADKRTLQSAAVIGRIFWPDPVGLLLNGERGQLGDALERLEEREFVRERLASTIAGQPEFIFKHILTRDVAYESLPRRERARAHATVAAWIERSAGERRAEFSELLAYHHAEAHAGQRDDPRADAATVEASRTQAFRALLEASGSVMRRFALEKAATLAERALALADGSLERAEALAQVGRVAGNDYRGDLAWRTFCEAADLVVAADPTRDQEIASLCASAVEFPLRWPGSMRDLPPEADVRPYLDTGFAHLGDGDSVERVRLLTARSFVPFGVDGRRAFEPGEVEAAERDGLEATDMALRLGQPLLASAALDAASSAPLTVGRFVRMAELSDRRLELRDAIEDPWELGDMYAMAAWGHSSIGNLAHAATLSREGERVAADAQRLNCLIHLGEAEFSLGHWDEVLDEAWSKTEAILGARIDEPPPFLNPLVAYCAYVAVAREDPSAERWIERLQRMNAGLADDARTSNDGWMAWVMVERGDLETARACLRHFERYEGNRAIQVAHEAIGELHAAAEDWGALAMALDEAEPFAREGGMALLLAHLVALRGRAAFATGDPSAGIAKLEEASHAFAAMEAVWDRARTDLFLAEALIASGRVAEARQALGRAVPDLERLGARREMRRGRELTELSEATAREAD